MLGYHDCPPHMCETLDEVYDAQWIQQFKLTSEEIQDTFKKIRDLNKHQHFGGVRVRGCGCGRRYK